MRSCLQNPLVSIIVPAYNSESTISYCIQSIIGQSYTNWELIIVDDGSSDCTSEVCGSFAKGDSRLFIHIKEKAGVSAARNKGLDLAKGDLIVFVDSDDELPSNSIQKRVEAIMDADMVIGMYSTVGEGEKCVSIENGVGSLEYCSQETAMLNTVVVGQYGYQGYIWNKIFRKRIIDKYQIRFADDISYNEDRLFCVEYILKCEKICICSDIIYFYKINSAGVMAATKNTNKKDKDKYLSELVAFDRMAELLKDNETCYYLIIADAHMRTIQLMNATPKVEKEFHAELKKKLSSYTIQALSAPDKIISKKRKMKMLGHALLGK